METKANPIPIVIDTVIDVVCPWCFIGKRTLDRAVTAFTADLSDHYRVYVRYHPFQLSPDTPEEGVGRDAYYEKKFGNSPQFQETRKYLVERGKSLDIHFDYDRDSLIANTLDAHRLIYWAQSAGPGTQAKIADYLMQAYFEDCKFLGDKSLLLEIAGKADMDQGLVSDLLSSDRDKQAIRQKVADAYNMGITGVPFFILNGKVVLRGAVDEAEIITGLESLLPVDPASGDIH